MAIDGPKLERPVDLANLLDVVATWLFRNIVMWVLLLSGAFLTVRYGLVQLRRLPEATDAGSVASTPGAGARGADSSVPGRGIAVVVFILPGGRRIGGHAGCVPSRHIVEKGMV